ncbi:MAG: hypothetical protein E7207_05465 [Clostridium butyricum]|nr:hypothetical protein [Clostridium butyricum]
MIRNVSKVCSFLLLFFISVLTLNQINIFTFSNTLKNIFYFLTLILIMFSSVTTLLTNKSGFFKFIGVVIIATLAVGGILFILKSNLNIVIYSCIILTTIYSMVDIFYKPL